MEIEAHDPHHAAESDLQDKGLSHNSVGVLGSVVLGISSVAPAYALTATIGILVAEAGSKMAVVIIAGFLPMFFAAYAYRELNKVAPDCGTSFTWTTKAFGPYVGWMGGWAAILATAIVLSNLAGVAVQFFYQFFGDLLQQRSLGALWENRGQRPDLSRLPGVRHPGGLPRHHHDREGAVHPGRVPDGGPAGLRGDGVREVRIVGDRHRVQLGLVQPGRPDVVGVHRRIVGIDLRVLGLGHLPDGQRGVARTRRRRPAGPRC